MVIEVLGGPSYTVICTPGDDVDLALGFCWTEGVIDSFADVAEVWPTGSGNSVRVRLVDGKATTPSRRQMLITSSCGLCGRTDIQEMLQALVPVSAPFSASLTALYALPGEVRRRQSLFDRTGGCHAAALFDSHGEPTVIAEDIGRHSALDKALGRALRDRLPTAEHGIFLSGRTSLELIIKAARAGVGLVVSVSAASATAIDVAQQLGITLCGFARGDELTIYTHPQRVTASACD